MNKCTYLQKLSATLAKAITDGSDTEEGEAGIDTMGDLRLICLNYGSSRGIRVEDWQHHRPYRFRARFKLTKPRAIMSRSVTSISRSQSPTGKMTEDTTAGVSSSVMDDSDVPVTIYGHSVNDPRIWLRCQLYFLFLFRSRVM